MEAVKIKKKVKVDPAETELDELGPPPSTEDLKHLFVVDDAANRPESSNAAFTEETILNDSRNASVSGANSKDGDEQASSRSSTPSSAAGLVKKMKRNVVAPIDEETSFGVDNQTFQDEDVPVIKPTMEAWSETGSVISSRPQTAPSREEEASKENLSRPSTAPNKGGRFRSNKITPTSTRASSPQLSERAVSPSNLFDSPVAVDSRSATKSPEKETEESHPLSLIKTDSIDNQQKDVRPLTNDFTNQDVIQEESSLVSYEAVLAPPESTGEHQAYVPMDYAKECIQKVIDDMKKMKANHYKVVEKIQEQYQLIEEESQAQFKEYVMKLRGEYSSKVATVKHVMQSHQDDFAKKQNFYEEAIKSLREKNKSLLFEKRQFLIKAKETSEKHKKEKNQILEDLVKMLDTKHKEYVILHAKFEEKRNQKQQCDEEIFDLKQRLDLTSGEKEKVATDVDALTQRNDELKQKLDAIESEKSKLDETCIEKEHLLSQNNETIGNKDQMIKDLQSRVAELETKLQDTRSSIKSVVAGDYVASKEEFATVSSQESSPVKISHAEEENVEQEIKTESSAAATIVPVESSEAFKELKTKTEEQEKELHESNEKIKKLQEEIDALQESIQSERNEKNIVKMELINMQEKNSILHARLETMLNEVIDSVNIDQTNTKLSELNSKKSELQTQIDEVKKQIDEWKDEYSKEHGHEPTEENRPENIQKLFGELKMKEENLSAVEKDILVLNMLLDGTLPDDMKQQENADNPKQQALEELEKQHAEEKSHLNDLIQMFKERAELLNSEKEELEKLLREKKTSVIPKETSIVTENTQVSSEASDEKIKELTEALQTADNNLALVEKEKDEEIEGVRKSLHKAEKKNSKLQTTIENNERELRDLKSAMKVNQETAEADIKLKQEMIDKLQTDLDKLNEEKLAKFPVKAKSEIKALQEKLKEAEANKSGKDEETLQLQSKINELQEQISNLTITNEELKKKEGELKSLQETERKYKELKKKYKSLEAKKTVTKTVASPLASPSKSQPDDSAKVKELEKKIAELEKQLLDVPTTGTSKEAGSSKKDGKADPKALLKLEKANELLKEKIEGLKKSAQADAEKIKELEQKVKEAKSKGDDKSSKKQEKAMKDLQKKFESEQKKTAKLKENFDKEKAETERLTKELATADSDRKKLTEEIGTLGVAAQEGLEAVEKVKELTKSNKSLTEENKTLAENFNSERILRKKYYNMVEDMKGKIRVYCRARPLSRSELDRGNYNILSSPDEYSLIVQTPRGPKDFQYDAVFTPDQSQEKVFEDTNNLIQSAVDGYNVCIFAYGQTGSGKTFTMIGDKEQKFPGIAPRAFEAIYRLIDENKGKFSFKTYMYMLELYRDNLIDLFGDQKNPAKLDIKKDKKGMVQVVGSVVQEATSSSELMEIFERGSANRHVASTKMNAESSRSHLVLSIIIESTNMTSGAVVKGKLSLVDLAGSERANKTGASAEQLKEAQSINKSLSALGDVISALSSEQSFIPYRNNKLTLLMQDSLGGNAKTLMFVNISPADYNADETVTSLTYASRVKLITNDASKNSDNKEIARLKGIISKLKKGERIDEDED